MPSEINLKNIHTLSKGAAFLGSGGGGDTNELLPIVMKALKQYGPIPLLSIAELRDEDYVVAIELIGAPIPKNDRHFPAEPFIKSALDLAAKDLGKPIRAIMPVEIGGSNALTPLCVAGEASFPVLDADLLGRALPKIQMISTNIFGIMPSKAYICDPQTGASSIIQCTSYEELESKARAIAAQHQSTAAVLIPIILSGKQAKFAAVHHTMSLAISIGSSDSLQELCNVIKGNIRFTGRISKWDYTVQNGFLLGRLHIRSEHDEIFEIHVQNEYLKLTKNNLKLAEAPEIISLLHPENLQPILSDQIEEGQQIICVTSKGPDLWHLPRGLEIIKSAKIL